MVFSHQQPRNSMEFTMGWRNDGFFREAMLGGKTKGWHMMTPSKPSKYLEIQAAPGNDTGWSLFPEIKGRNWDETMNEFIQVGEMMGWDDSICGSNELPPLTHWSLTLGSKWGAGMCRHVGMIWMLDNLRYDFGKFWDNEDRADTGTTV